MPRASFLYFTFAFCLLPFVFVSGQSTPFHNIDNVKRWLDAGERHSPGEVDSPLRTAGAWADDDLDTLIVDVNALVQLVVRSGGPLLPRTVRGFTADEMSALQALAG